MQKIWDDSLSKIKCDLSYKDEELYSPEEIEVKIEFLFFSQILNKLKNEICGGYFSLVKRILINIFYVPISL